MEYVTFLEKTLPPNITKDKRYEVLRKGDFNVAILNDVGKEDYFRFGGPNPTVKFI